MKNSAAHCVARFPDWLASGWRLRALFHEGGVETKGATVHERVIGHLEGFAAALRRGGAGDDLFVHLQVGLKIQLVAGIPFLLPGDRRNIFLAKAAASRRLSGFAFAADVPSPA